ncbi:MAG TPA: lipid-A-disaccharide synthase [bacterium]|nr:lipid-A-disaccharide synthase [bacterium]
MGSIRLHRPAANRRRVLVVAGEASSDLHCASLINELKSLRPDLGFVGVGGENMRAQGVELFADVRELGVVGVSEVFKKLSRILAAYRQATRLMRSGEIAAAIFVDYPDFNLRLAARARKCEVPVLYYISPQVWAWRRGRVRRIAQLVDEMLVLFQFEKELYELAGVDVRFVGHPLLDTVKPTLDKEEFLERVRFDQGKPVVALLPGSRTSEIERLLPVFLEAARFASSLLDSKPLQMILALAKTIDPKLVAHMLSRYPEVVVVRGQTYDALAASDAALVASGTATLEAAILGVPMIVGYKVSFPTYLVGKLLIRVDHVALPNIIAGKRVVPELIQSDLTPERLGRELASLLEDAGLRKQQKDELKRVTGLLGECGASKRAAGFVAEFLGKTMPPDGSART